MVKLGEHFASDDRSRHSEWLRQQQWFIKARQDNQRRDTIEDKSEQDVSAFATAVVMATATQVEEFEVKLDSYDEAIVIALMENQELMDAINAKIDALLAQAYVMDDGRRVFKTEDGQQVFDEFGAEVSHDELDFELIGVERPTYEAYETLVSDRAQLEAERTEILGFQEKVDAAHEQISEGEISEADLDALDADLLDVMPASVRDHVAGLEPATPAPVLKAGFTATAVVPQMQNAEASAPAPAPFQ